MGGQQLVQLGLDGGMVVVGLRESRADWSCQFDCPVQSFLFRYFQHVGKFALDGRFEASGVLEMLQVPDAETHQGRGGKHNG
jgi:hypothetical protein